MINKIQLGLGSATGLLTGIITVFCDLWPEKNKVGIFNLYSDNLTVWEHIMFRQESQA